MTEKAVICACAGCRQDLFEGDDLVQNPVYKMGELDYIELAHRACIPEWAVNDDWKGEDEDPYTSAADIAYFENFDLDAYYARLDKEHEAILEEEAQQRRNQEEDFLLGAPIVARKIRTRKASHFQRDRVADTYNPSFAARGVRRAERRAGKSQTRELLSAYS